MPTPSRPRYEFLCSGQSISEYADLKGRAPVQKCSILPPIANGCPVVVSTVMAAIGQFERALIGDHIRSGLEREVRG